MIRHVRVTDTQGVQLGVYQLQASTEAEARSKARLLAVRHFNMLECDLRTEAVEVIVGTSGVDT